MRGGAGASIAKNITVNFNRKGNLTPPINALYMFFNASVQGTARLAQSVLTSKTAAAAVGGIAIMGFLLDALNRAGHKIAHIDMPLTPSRVWSAMNA